MAKLPCKNLYGKVDQLDQLDTGLCQLCQVGHAKNRSALSALFALLMVKVQKVQIVQCKNLHEILEIVEIVRWKVPQESQLSHVIFLRNGTFAPCRGRNQNGIKSRGKEERETRA